MSAEKSGSQERIKEIMVGIENGIQDLFQSGKLESYLKTMSKFHHYSLNNTILIYLQRPDATYCAGYQTWKNEFGRHVKKGEKGIKILAPAPFKKTVRVEKLDPVTHAPVRDASGQTVTEEQTIQVPHYKTVTIAAVSHEGWDTSMGFQRTQESSPSRSGRGRSRPAKRTRVERER